LNRTVVRRATGRRLLWASGDWECLILGRVARLMGTPHFLLAECGRGLVDQIDKRVGRKPKPDWFFSDQPYELDGSACKEFAEALINVTDEVIATIHPWIHTQEFKGSPEELKAAVIW
jgi:hypothetical protein